MIYSIILGAAFLTVCAAQQQKYTTPVPILKQINRHNEDGSYSYGYEGGDGGFKIETKYANGEVYGKYGYVDVDTGKVREVEYGASRRGFEPSGNDINVAPPTIPQNQDTYPQALGPNEEDDGQYREDPSIYYQSEGAASPATSRYQQPAYQQPAYKQPAYQAPAPVYQQPKSIYQQPKPVYQQPKSIYQQPAYQEPSYEEPQQYYRPPQNYNKQAFLNSDFFRSFNNPSRYNNPAPRYDPPAPRYNNPAPKYNNPQPNYNNGFNNYAGHPAQNLDINTGSYTVNY